MDVEKEKGVGMTTKEEPMETENTLMGAAGNSTKTDLKDVLRETGIGRAEVKQEPGLEEEDDPVIHEIPVYLSKTIPKLYLFQVSVQNRRRRFLLTYRLN